MAVNNGKINDAIVASCLCRFSFVTKHKDKRTSASLIVFLAKQWKGERASLRIQSARLPLHNFAGIASLLSRMGKRSKNVSGTSFVH